MALQHNNTGVGRIAADPDPDSISMILVFLMAAIISLFNFSLLAIIIRKLAIIKRYQVLRVFLLIGLYILSRFLFCGIAIVQIIYGISTKWNNLSPSVIELLFKDSLIFGEIVMVGLFLVVFEQYLIMILKLTKQTSPVLISRIQKVLQGIQILYIVSTSVMFLLLNIKVIKFGPVNILAVSYNSIFILIFISSYFYTSFLMTGILLSRTHHERLNKLYKYLLILLLSRFLCGGFGFVIALLVAGGNFEGYINLIEENSSKFIIQCIIFIGYMVYILLTEGVQIMYTLRKSTLQLFCHEPEGQNPILDTLNQNLVNQSSADEPGLLASNVEISSPDLISLASFNDLELITEIKSEVWSYYRGKHHKRSYFIRKAMEGVSNYLVEDVASQLNFIRSKNIREINSMSYFVEQGILLLFEPYRQFNLDSWVSKYQSQKEKIAVLLMVAKAIQKIHENSLAHGTLRPSNIFVIPETEGKPNRISFSGYGLRPLRRYLAMTTEYTNKTCYTAVEHLKDRNNVVLKPTKQSDVYSFGMLIYQAITGIKTHRKLSLSQLEKKMVEQSTRPKIPQQCNEQLKSIIRKCWQEQIQKRPSMSAVIFELQSYLA